MSNLHNQGASEWAALHFGKTDIKDPRRRKRLQTIASGYASQPSSSIPQLFTRISDVKASYTFFDREDLNPEAIQGGHKAIVQSQLQQAGTYLLIEDSSEFTWADTVARPGLGRMREHKQGFVLHSSLAVKWEAPKSGQSKRDALRVIGLSHQEFYPRIARPEGEGNEQSHVRQKRPRESQLWQRSSQTIGLAPATPQVRWVRVADRGADIEWFLRDCLAHHHGFVVRAAQNRSLVDEHHQPLTDKLFETVRQAKAIGDFNLELRARSGQAARMVCLSVSISHVRLRPTRQPGFNAGRREPLACTVIRVWEATPKNPTKRLAWILLTDVAITSFEEALEVALHYASRWLIEEYHKCLKTGLGADKLQLETAPRLFTAIAIMAIVAVRLLALKELVHLNAAAPANTSGLSALELQVLSITLQRDLQTVHDVALALGRLGGHMNRPSDGLPGWQSLWAGMRKLITLLEGVMLAQSLKSFGV
jgi:Transposase DNA-binding